MALDTYADLVAAVGDWLARADLAPRIPDFVALAEARIAYGSGPPWPSEPVRVRAMEAEAVLAVEAAAVPLPAGFLEAIRLELDGTPPSPVESAAPEYLRLAAAGLGVRAGRPRLYAIEGGNLVFAPAPDGAYTARLLHLKRFDPLAAAATNWLIANAPAVYLQATLLEAALYTRDDERAPVFHAAFRAAVEGINLADARGRSAGTMMRVRPSVGAV